MKKIIVFSGAGLSAESGIPTFRDPQGIWENYKIEDIAAPIGWMRNKELVLDFLCSSICTDARVSPKSCTSGDRETCYNL